MYTYVFVYQYGVSVAQDGIVRIWRIRRLITLHMTLIVGEGKKISNFGCLLNLPYQMSIARTFEKFAISSSVKAARV